MSKEILEKAHYTINFSRYEIENLYNMMDSSPGLLNVPIYQKIMHKIESCMFNPVKGRYVRVKVEGTIGK